LIKKSTFNNLLVNSAFYPALYHVRLKTYGDSSLFELPNAERCERASLPKPSPVSSIAQVVADELLLAAEHRGITLQQWVILPNELHALIGLPKDPTAFPGNHSTSKPRLLTAFVATFKAATAKRINLLRNQPGAWVWQRSYNEQLIKDELTLSSLQHKLLNLEEIVMSS
jgi:REP element-mobilizing transposase RayT